MPIYDYQCKECGYKFDEFFQSARLEKIPNCPKCKGKEIKKLITKPLENPFGSITWFKFE